MLVVSSMHLTMKTHHWASFGKAAAIVQTYCHLLTQRNAVIDGWKIGWWEETWRFEATSFDATFFAFRIFQYRWR